MTRRAWVIVLITAVLGGMATVLVLWRFGPAVREWRDSRLKVIDDFNDGEDPNLIGGESFTQTFAGARLDASARRLSGPGAGELSLALDYTLPPQASFAWGTGLNALDISAAKALRFWVKTEADTPPQLLVQLIDAMGAKSQQVPVPLRGTQDWQRVVLPTAAFSGADPDQLGRLVLRATAAEVPLKGTLYVDDLAFLGPPRVFFRSLADNLYGFPRRSLVKTARLQQLSGPDLLRAIAQDTWGYFRDVVDTRHHLPLNYIQMKPTPLIGDYTSTTDIAMYLLSVISAYDFDFVDQASAVKRLRNTLQQLSALTTWRGHFYNYYSTTNLQVTRRYVSSVDNAWLAAALIVTRQAFPELKPLADGLLDDLDFGEFYDPENGQMRLGYEEAEGRLAPYHYGLLATEARIISVVAIGKEDVPEEHWFRVYRTLPKEWTWQRQAPQGEVTTYHGREVFQGYYVYDDGAQRIPFVPSWGGSLFEFLMPTLVVDEQHYAPWSLGLNNQRAVEIHIQYALDERGYPVWGLSPCATPAGRHGGYSEFGVAGLGVKGYKDEAIVTPHVTMLSLLVAPEAVEANIRRLLERYELYGPYGFYDAVDIRTGDVAYRYLALDQGMSLIALNNYLNNGAIQRRFAQDPVMQRVKPLLDVERFFDRDDAFASRQDASRRN